MNAAAINILVVDDHSMVIEGMKAILARIPSVALVTTAGNAIEAIAALRTNKVDVAFLDINMPDISGIELCAKVKKEFPAVHVLALSTFKQRSYVSQMIAGGASGYLLKSAGKEEIEEAIHAVVTGRMFFSVDINNNAVQTPTDDEPPTLTRREKEILKLIAGGMTNNEIAEKIFVSPYTVDTHRKNLLSKFEVNNTAMLIRKAADYRML
ncbi:MAG TPA: response regulator transcription factor [Panacibacter sp.]|nr:response regulator transcription factor [Panacibacter sp.]HNP45059.1 response regulator transcription factor [Panacibacter sp.]